MNKYFMRNSKHQAIGIDRTFNLGNYYVTTLVYINQRVVGKESTKNKHDNQDTSCPTIFLVPFCRTRMQRLKDIRVS